jgi:ketosteroid isomerase-like protein
MSLPAEISGRETPAGDGSALDALIDFYRSFNASDLKALAANWAEGDAPSMDNPIGGIRRGWPAIRAALDRAQAVTSGDASLEQSHG